MVRALCSHRRQRLYLGQLLPADVGFYSGLQLQRSGTARPVECCAFLDSAFSRLYPVYIFGLLVSLGMLMAEWQVRSHGEFALGVALTPLLLQGWIPLATFWNTPAWTMCTEAFFYLIFPVVVCWKRPRRLRYLIGLLALLWLAGMVLPTLYTILQPDGPNPNRYTDSFWMRALKSRRRRMCQPSSSALCWRTSILHLTSPTAGAYYWAFWE